MVLDSRSIRIPDFADSLLRWFAQAKRPLPWRVSYTPYEVWISEIMLQQTQMERGVNYFNNWMRRFPDITSVAAADEEEVLAAWEGLGYYSRARNLHKTAKCIVRDHDGEFPSSPEEIRALPGVGDYTAGAIASIAFNAPVPAVDANVLRIFSRLCDIVDPVEDKIVKAEVAALVGSLIPPDSARLFNQALMELGALICSKTPQCAECPVAEHCAARSRGTESARPVKGAKAGYRTLELSAGITVRDGRVFIRKRPPQGLWAGLWEFPGGSINPGEEPEQAAVRHAEQAMGCSAAVRRKIAVVRHGYTTWRVTLHGYLLDADPGDKASVPPSEEGIWIPPEDVTEYAFAAGHRKLLEKLGWKQAK